MLESNTSPEAYEGRRNNSGRYEDLRRIFNRQHPSWLQIEGVIGCSVDFIGVDPKIRFQLHNACNVPRVQNIIWRAMREIGLVEDRDYVFDPLKSPPPMYDPTKDRRFVPAQKEVEQEKAA